MPNLCQVILLTTILVDSEELNFQNPSSLSGPLTVGQPHMLMAQLKEYQLKGLNWLATLYEQGINGILADEMGLGKTVQSISLLAYLAETHDIWGPFLVVAPLSTLHNWQQELTRFVPTLKALPYWGNVKDRATLRKFWSKKEISYNKDAPFHVLITSYQLVTQDQQYFQRVKWQYMILDEAQNIKNASSVRWKTLLGFHCRNRLLLTGTPIQNNMQGALVSFRALLGFDPDSYVPYRTLGAVTLHYAESIRFTRRVQRVVLERHRECCREQGQQTQRTSTSSIAYDPQTVHVAPHQEERAKRTE